MAESSDYSPGVWKGHDFKSAKRAYADVIDRGYGDAVAAGKDTDDVLPDSIVCNATSTLTIVVDVTGSMGSWPQTIFSKLPYLEHEAKEYLGEDTEIGFGAVGDANSDKYPVQAVPYSKGLDLKDQLAKIIVEGKGGSNESESYELTSLYYARNVDMPKATHPILIMIGDENYYDVINPDQAKRYAKTVIPQRVLAEEVFDELKSKYTVYLIRKCYGYGGPNSRNATDQRIQDRWVKIFGEDHVVDLPDPERVVDVIFGILAKETGRIPYFQMELEERQKDDPKKIETVYKSLATVHVPRDPAALPKDAGHSTRHHTSDDSAKTKSLL